MPYPYEFIEDSIPSWQALCIRRTTTLAGIERALDGLFGEVADYLRELDVEPAGPPFACYHSIGAEELDVEAGFPVDRTVPSRWEIRAVRLDGGPAVITTHTGAYEPVTYAEAALRGWLAKQCLEAVGPLIEVHLADPMQAVEPRRGRIKLIQRVEPGPVTGQGEAVEISRGLGTSERPSS